MQVAEGLDGLIHQPLCAFPVGDIVAIGDRFAAHRCDFVDDLVGRSDVGAGAVSGTAQVVADHLRAVLGEHQAVLTPDAAGTSGHDDDTAFAQLAHDVVGPFPLASTTALSLSGVCRGDGSEYRTHDAPPAARR